MSRALTVLIAAIVLSACGGAPVARVPTPQPAIPTPAPSDTSAPPPSPTSVPTEAATATIEPATPTAEPSPTVEEPTPTAAPQTAGIGSTASVQNWDITLYDAQLVDSYSDDVGRTFENTGFKYVMLDFGLKRTAGIFSDTRGIGAQVISPDGNSFSCFGGIDNELPVGYEVRVTFPCQVPVTVASDLEVFTAVVIADVMGTRIGDVQASFSLAEQTGTPEVALSPDPAFIIAAGEPITVDFGNNQDRLELVVSNLRWSGEFNNAKMEYLEADFTVTNNGIQAVELDFFLVQPIDVVNRTVAQPADLLLTALYAPPPGQTQTLTLRIGALKPHDGPVPVYLIPMTATLNGKEYIVIESTASR